jgi:hypothetical protein
LRRHAREDTGVHQRQVLGTVPDQLRQKRLFATLTHHCGASDQERRKRREETNRCSLLWRPEERSNRARSLPERLARLAGVEIGQRESKRGNQGGLVKKRKRPCG